MGKASKILITVILTIVFLFVFSAIGNSGAETGSILGWIALFLLAGYIGALVAIWKKSNSKDIDKKE